MKRYVLNALGDPGKLTLEDTADPEPGPGEVLVRVRACSLNYRDLMVLRGDYGQPPAFPLVPLSDAAGEVTAVGNGVSEFEPGDRVAGCFFQNWHDGRLTDKVYGSDLGFKQPGVLSELRVFPEGGLVKLPRYLSFAEGACLPCAGLTAYNAVVPHANSQSTVLCLGTGGVSLFALMFARAAGARVIITSSSDEKLERAIALGADEGVNYRTHEDWDEEVLRLTGGVDLVVETGGAATFGKSLNALAPGGRISLMGRVTGKADSVNAHGLVYKNACVQGLFVGSRKDFQDMNAIIDQVSVSRLIDNIMPFAEAARAFEYLGAGRHMGKVVISLDQSST